MKIAVVVFYALVLIFTSGCGKNMEYRRKNQIRFMEPETEVVTVSNGKC